MRYKCPCSCECNQTSNYHGEVCYRCDLGYHAPVLRSDKLDGKLIGYSKTTEFLIQFAKGRNSYKTKAKVVGSLQQAVYLYNSLNVGPGFVARLYAPSLKKPVLARKVG